MQERLKRNAISLGVNNKMKAAARTFSCVVVALVLFSAISCARQDATPAQPNPEQLVEEWGHLRNLSAQLSGFQRRRHRRPERHHLAPRLPAGTGHRRHLAHAHLSLAASRLRLRHLRLQQHRPAVRNPCRLRSPRRRSKEAQHRRDHGSGPEPHLRQASRGSGSPPAPAPIPKPTGTCGTTRRWSTATASRPTTGSPSSAIRRGNGTRRASSTTTTASTFSSPT